MQREFLDSFLRWQAEDALEFWPASNLAVQAVAASSGMESSSLIASLEMLRAGSGKLRIHARARRGRIRHKIQLAHAR
eukprot:2661617-Amphidinium_carterae.2